MESGWNVWVWLVGVVIRRWVWLVGVGGINRLLKNKTVIVFLKSLKNNRNKKRYKKRPTVTK